MDAAGELGWCADTVERACADLVNGAPAALDRCAEALGAAAGRMPLLVSGAVPSADALAEAWRLRRSLGKARALLENAAAYHRGWRERLAVQLAGYAPDGSPGAVTPAGRLWIEA